MPTRHAPRRVDASQKAIVAALRAAGGPAITVVSTADAGQGFPDLAIGLLGVTYLAEVKTGTNVPSRRRFTPAQVAWIEAWQGSPVVVFLSAEAATTWVEHRLRKQMAT